MPNPEPQVCAVYHHACFHAHWTGRYKFKKGLYVSMGIRINGGYRSIDGYLVSFDFPTVIVKSKKDEKHYSTDHCGNVLPYLDQSHLEPKQLTINF
jgi:hypothetical protein